MRSGVHLRGGGGGDGDGDGGGSLPQRYWAKYLDLLETKPLATKMATGFVIGVFGDLLSQHLSGSESPCRLFPACLFVRVSARRLVGS